MTRRKRAPPCWRWWLGVSVAVGFCAGQSLPTTNGAERSGALVPEGVWQCGAGGLCRGADSLRGLGRDGPPRERGTDGDAGDDGSRELAQTFE